MCLDNDRICHTHTMSVPSVTSAPSASAFASLNTRSFNNLSQSSMLSVSNLVQDLDMSLTILRLREIAAQLLGEGNLNLHSDTESIEDWLRLLKRLLHQLVLSHR